MCITLGLECPLALLRSFHADGHWPLHSCLALPGCPAALLGCVDCRHGHSGPVCAQRSCCTCNKPSAHGAFNLLLLSLGSHPPESQILVLCWGG